MAKQSEVQDWQVTKKTVLERNAYMFNNPLMSDITFTCGHSDKKLFAHKYVLATSSPVFYAMFYGDLAEENSGLTLTDTDEESFKEFLRFLYKDECQLTPELVANVVYLAKKYIVPSLIEKCIYILRKILSPENVMTILEHVIHSDENELEKECWDFIESHTVEIVISEAFIDISQQTLIRLLQRDKLRIPEVVLFHAVLKWSDSHCLKNGLDATTENRRAILGDAFYHIRFLSMSQQEFARYVSSSGLLTDREIVPIFEKFNGFEVPDLKWKQPKRQEPYITHFARFRREDVKRPDRLRHRSGIHRLSFSVNQPAILCGVRLFGDAGGSQYKVSLKLNTTVNVSGTYATDISNQETYGFDVMLPEPIILRGNQIVEMVATIEGPNSYYGTHGEKSVEVDDVIVTFDADFKRGQFHQILLIKMQSNH